MARNTGGLRLDRRQLLRALGGAGAAVAIGGGTSACAGGRQQGGGGGGAGEVIRIGHVSPETGPPAPFGEADQFVIDASPTAT